MRFTSSRCKEENGMGKNVLVISTSPRARSNSNGLADAFIEGARKAGHNVEKVSLRGKKISFCQGCMACMKLQKCVIADDAVDIAAKMGQADVLVFATPIYYYEMSGQMKTMLDRANPLYTSDYRFRDVYMLTTAAEDAPNVPDRAVSGLQGWIDCFEKARLAGSVFAGGLNGPGEVAGHPALDTAREMGGRI